MLRRTFLFPLAILILLAVATTPAIVKPLLPTTPTTTPTPTPPPPTPTASLTPTPDLFAHVPTATPYGASAPVIAFDAFPTVPPTFAPTTTATLRPPTATLDVVLTPAPTLAVTEIPTPLIPAVPTSTTITKLNPPSRLVISRLGLDVPVIPVGMVPAVGLPGVFEWDVPAYKAAGWLETSAPLGAVGNTVLDGHHNIKGEVFKDLWTLEAGDEIVLRNADTDRVYHVSEVLILPERDQPLETRLANAAYLQPTADERLTLITCYPYTDN